MERFLAYGRQSISEADIQAVVEVLRSDFLTQGPAIDRFEEAFAQTVGAPFAVACANGTAALHLCTLAAGVKPGERALVTPISFVASANCVRYVGGTVDFSDVDPETITLSPEKARDALEAAKRAGKPFRMLVTVDLAGHPCDIEAFAELKKKYQLTWIHDACHSLGATWKDKEGKSHRIGDFPDVDLIAYSFHPVKHITTGEGGMVTTHRGDLADRLKIARTHGITKSPQAFSLREEALDKDGTVNPWYYEMQSLGMNYRLTDFQAMLGVSQLSRLPEFLRRRREIAAQYRRDLAGLDGIHCLPVRQGVEHAYHLFVVRADFSQKGITRAQLMMKLRAKQIGTQVHYIPIPMMPYYGRNAEMNHWPEAQKYYREALSLPCYPDLTPEDVSRVTSALREIWS